MRSFSRHLLILIALLCSALARNAAAQVATEIATGTSVPLAPGMTVQLFAVNGEASFLKAPGDQVLIEFARTVPADIKVFMVKTTTGLTVCSVYPSTDPKKPTGCGAGGTGQLANGKVKDLSSIKFRIRVPDGVHVSAFIQHGDLKSMDIAGNLDFYSPSGDLLIYDGGGRGTIHATIGMVGNIDVAIAKAQKGPLRRDVQLRAPGSGRVRVVLPTTVSVSYRVGTQRPAVIDPIFAVKKVAPPILIGQVGPLGESVVHLDVDTGIAAQFVMQAAK